MAISVKITYVLLLKKCKRTIFNVFAEVKRFVILVCVVNFNIPFTVVCITKNYSSAPCAIPDVWRVTFSASKTCSNLKIDLSDNFSQNFVLIELGFFPQLVSTLYVRGVHFA